MLEILSGLLGSSAVGGLVGGVLAIFNRRLDIKAKSQEYAFLASQQSAQQAHERGLRKDDLEIAQAEAAGRRDVAIVEGDARESAARMDALASAHAASALTEGQLREAGAFGRVALVVADVLLLKPVRPLATAVLTAMALWLSYELIGQLRADGWATLSPDQKLSTATTALNWCFGQASAALSYWFLSRDRAAR